MREVSQTSPRCLKLREDFGELSRAAGFAGWQVGRARLPENLAFFAGGERNPWRLCLLRLRTCRAATPGEPRFGARTVLASRIFVLK